MDPPEIFIQKFIRRGRRQGQAGSGRGQFDFTRARESRKISRCARNDKQMRSGLNQHPGSTHLTVLRIQFQNDLNV
jgi:hypothetical protein